MKVKIQPGGGPEKAIGFPLHRPLNYDLQNAVGMVDQFSANEWKDDGSGNHPAHLTDLQNVKLARNYLQAIRKPLSILDEQVLIQVTLDDCAEFRGIPETLKFSAQQPF